jgi:two-component system chemotaxis sensor kinase CheA
MKEREVTYEDILEDVSRIKKRPIYDLLSSYTKLVANLSARLNKEVYPMDIIGGDTIFVQDSFKSFAKTLVHVFRNSIDHGIETIDQRIKLGKDEKATISCNISENEDFITVEIVDDGKGIDPQIIKDKALEKSIYTKRELDQMSDEQLQLIIFEDAFSTKENVSELSGRGIGLGAVKSECEELGGKIQIQSIINKGSTFRFIFPNTI